MTGRSSREDSASINRVQEVESLKASSRLCRGSKGERGTEAKIDATKEDPSRNINMYVHHSCLADNDTK